MGKTISTYLQTPIHMHPKNIYNIDGDAFFRAQIIWSKADWKFLVGIAQTYFWAFNCAYEPQGHSLWLWLSSPSSVQSLCFPGKSCLKVEGFLSVVPRFLPGIQVIWCSDLTSPGLHALHLQWHLTSLLTELEQWLGLLSLKVLELPWWKDPSWEALHPSSASCQCKPSLLFFCLQNFASPAVFLTMFLLQS